MQIRYLASVWDKHEMQESNSTVFLAVHNHPFLNFIYVSVNSWREVCEQGIDR